MITKNDLELELKKRGWEQYLDFAISELNRGVPIKDVFRAITEKDLIEFEKNLNNPEKMYLPKSYLVGETEIILGGKEKIEGHMEVRGNAKIIPNCNANQSPYRRKNIIWCGDDPQKEGI